MFQFNFSSGAFGNNPNDNQNAAKNIKQIQISKLKKSKVVLTKSSNLFVIPVAIT